MLSQTAIFESERSQRESSLCYMALSRSSMKQYIASVRSYIREVLSLGFLFGNKSLGKGFSFSKGNQALTRNLE